MSEPSVSASQLNVSTGWDWVPETTVEEIEYDDKGRIIKRTTTRTTRPERKQVYPYITYNPNYYTGTYPHTYWNGPTC